MKMYRSLDGLEHKRDEFSCRQSAISGLQGICGLPCYGWGGSRTHSCSKAFVAAPSGKQLQ